MCSRTSRPPCSSEKRRKADVMNGRLIALASPIFALGAATTAQAQAADPPERPFSIVKSDPSLDALIAPDAKLETVARDFGLTEGPVWVPEGKSGYLLLSDLTANV